MPELAPTKRIEDLLVEQNLLTAQKVQELKLESAKVGRPIEDLIGEKKLVGGEALAQVRSQVLGVPYTNLGGLEPHPV